MTYFFLCFLTSFVIAFASIPTIIRIATSLSLYDKPNERKLHRVEVPLLGGIAIFGATLFAFTIWSAPFFEQVHLFIIASLIIIFFFGLRDDIAPLAPLKKLSGQIIASFIVIIYCDIRLQGLHGMFGLHALSWPASLIWTILAMLFIINAYNLIDGIDGLSSGLGIISSFVFGLLFYINHDFLMSVLAFSLCGGLSGFIPYNFQKARIFMGDTGTMTIGFILSVFSIHLMELSRDAVTAEFSYFYTPVIVFALLVIPVTDMVRVFIIRIITFRSPFSADRNHVHHCLLGLGLSTIMTNVLLYSVSIIFIGAAWVLRNENASLVFYLLTICSFILVQLPHTLLLINKSQQAA